MRTAMSCAVVAALCALAMLASAQVPPAAEPCPPSETCPGGCPPSGDAMGQSNYQRATHTRAQQPSASATQPVPVTVATAAEQAPEPIPYVEPSGAGAEFFATTPIPNPIAVDDEFVYVLRGNEVVKLTKRDMKVVSVTELPAPPRPQ